MTTPDQAPLPGRAPLSPVARWIGIVTLVVAIAGLLSQGVLGLLSLDNPDFVLAYAKGLGIKVSFGLAFANLFICILHYHRTHMRLDMLTRILSYVWILASVVFLLAWKRALTGG